MPYKGKQSLESKPREVAVFDEWYLYDLHQNVNTDSMNAFITGEYKLGRTEDGKFISYKDENGNELVKTITKNNFFEFIREHAASGNLGPKNLMDGIVFTMGSIAEQEGLFNLE